MLAMMDPESNNGMVARDTANTLMAIKVDPQQMAIGYFKLNKLLWQLKAQSSKQATDVLFNGYNAPLKSTAKHL